MTKFEALFQEFKEALSRFEEALNQEKTEFIRDSAIKRFELVFDLSWKVIKVWLEEEGVSCTSPLGCFKEAYHQGIIEFEEIWVDMVKTRNKTVHTYNLELAEEIYTCLPNTLNAFKKLLSFYEKK